MRLRVLFFFAFSCVALAPVFVLAAWVIDREYARELEIVEDTHLTIAKNLGAALDRYTRDIRNGFELVARAALSGSSVDGLEDFMGSLDFVHVCIADPNSGKILRSVYSEDRICPNAVPEKRLAVFLDHAKPDRTTFTPVMPNPSGQPTLYLVRLYEDRLAIGAFSTSYVVEQGRSIAFGERGHAAIVDNTGSLLAHPLEDWWSSMKNIARLEPVRRMLARETSTIVFLLARSEGRHGGRVHVRADHGVGVMIPQPLSELRDHTERFLFWTILVAAVAVASAAAASWFLASYLTRPLSSIASASRRMSEGEYSVMIPEAGGVSTAEVEELRQAFNTMSSDISAKNAALSAALEEANAGMREKTTFLTTITHEIRTPLNGILGIAEVLRNSSGTSSAAEQKEMFEMLRGSADRLLTIVDDVLEMSRIEAGQVKVRRTPTTVRRLIADIMSEFGGPARAKALSLDSDIDADVPDIIESDPTRLYQILSNLVVNAVKFTTHGGVYVRVRRSANRGGGDQIVFVVKDTGIGIERESLAKLFQPFTQFRGPRDHHDRGGSGLGLSISKSLADLLGGTIGVDSTIGEGSTFRVSLPLVAVKGATAGTERQEVRTPAVSRTADLVAQGEVSLRSQPDPTPLAGQPSVDGMSHRILVAEDHPTNQWVLLRQLEGYGYVPDVYNNGRLALEAYRRGVYDLVLTDYLMPEMDGAELTAAVRKLDSVSGRHTPVVGLTANAFPEVLDRCSEAGMDDLMTKPVTGEALRMVLDGYLSPEAKEARTSFGDRVTEFEIADEDAEHPVFSRSSFDELFESDTMEGRIWLRQFLTLMDSQIEDLRNGRVKRDAWKLSADLHRLSGAAIAVGAESLAHVCRVALNTFLSHYEDDEADRRLTRVEAVAAATGKEIRAFLDTLDTAGLDDAALDRARGM